MRAVVQRVSEASVTIDGTTVGQIGEGLLVLLGVGQDDEAHDLSYVVRKVADLRIFEDDTGKMNHSVRDIAGSVLVVSQFTLYGDTRKGRRPSFVHAMHPDRATLMVDQFVAELKAKGLTVATGEFGAEMEVKLVNNGPVTILIDSEKTI